MTQIKSKIIERKNGSIKMKKPQWIVVHDTGSKWVDADGEYQNCLLKKDDYVEDYIVDSTKIIKVTDNCYEDNESFMDNYEKPDKTLYNSISIKMCIEKGKRPTDSTFQNTIYLIRYLAEKYKIGYDRVIRHYDCTYKCCPKSMSHDGWTSWWTFLEKIKNGRQLIGWHNINKYYWWYSIDKYGNYYKDSWQNIKGKWYLFNKKGFAQSGWHKSWGNWYYFNKNRDEHFGEMMTGWLKYNDKCYYLEERDGYNMGACYYNCTAVIDDLGYTFDENGYMLE
ncbi:N-acetylmuramoyl-L-alanine amidase [Clostridium sp. BJN0001]|uniref:N-acetylmuramoyl-L-alanine amidase n=1 Tax=Clostridium sp. BJN0001 TaxID=2930219 RepID=UPI001FD30ED0|nr:N-acetylmuramoyl-L-alanine amidase [Clostridium sp. BJN0001]